MKILAFETSCEHATVALLLGDEIIQRRLEGHANHSERLLPTVQALLAESQVSLSSLDAIAFGAGPGAFTGLRLSCGVAQGLAMGAGLGVAPICSLEALSLQGEGPRILVATDARMGEVYWAAFEMRDGLRMTVADPECIPPEHISAPGPGMWFGIGSAFEVYAASLHASLTTSLSGYNASLAPAARDVARLACVRVVSGDLLSPELAVPVYVRNKVAFTTAERMARGGRA
jgi:tRNA threonylcarbamoyladenosine biosynthesis protein TsaB